MNIVLVTETQSGCYKWRGAIPAKYLQRRGHTVQVFSGGTQTYQVPDAMVFFRAHFLEARKMVEQCRQHSVRVVVDTDDALDLVPTENVNYASLQSKLPVYEFLLREADIVTTTTPTLAEHLRGAGMGCDDFVCLWGEVGVGAGIIAGGRPLTGRSGFAGEVGHLPLSPAGRLCHCGARGCWETEVGEDALLRVAGRSGSGGPSAVDQVLAMADAGEPAAQGAIESSGQWLAVGLAALIHILNPERIALGGFFATILPYARDALDRTLAELAIEPLAVAKIVPARLGADGPLIGAAELAFEHWLDDPASVPLIDRPSWSSTADRRRAAKEVDGSRLAI